MLFKKNILLLFIAFSCCNILSNAQSIELVNNGKSDKVIVMPRNASEDAIKAVKVFQDYFQQVTGVTLPIVENEVKENAIIIGCNSSSELNEIDFSGLGKHGFIIKTKNSNLIIAGNTERGTLYGVYAFIEKYLGCRKYSANVSFISKKTSIVLGNINDYEVPAFSLRQVNYNEARNREYMDWHALEFRGINNFEWGSWIHTFHQLLSPDDYGESNPEYFSYSNGKRQSGVKPSFDNKSTQPVAQLCLTNPDVFRIVCESLERKIEQNPGAKYWSVSQNDNMNFCKCEDCAELDKKFQSHMGSLLVFLNKVAERFPDKIISTLAYTYSRKPPVGIKPRENVNFVLCNIESVRNKPLVIGDTLFMRELREWTNLTNNIVLFDYVVQYSNLLAPFPNFKTLQPNLKTYRGMNVSMMYQLGNSQAGGEFAELRSYLISKLLWNSDLDIDSIMNDFLEGYYLEAAPEIKKYIQLLLENNGEFSGEKLTIYGSPIQERDLFLSDSLINIYNKLFDAAEQKVLEKPDVLKRVKEARLPVYYSMLEIAKLIEPGEKSAFIFDRDGELVPNPEIKKILYEFSYGCMQRGVTRLSEHHTSPQEYLKRYLEFLQFL